MDNLLKEMQRLKEENQDKYMLDLLDKVKWLAEKSNQKDYLPTAREKEMFKETICILNELRGVFGNI